MINVRWRRNWAWMDCKAFKAGPIRQNWMNVGKIMFRIVLNLFLGILTLQQNYNFNNPHL